MPSSLILFVDDEPNVLDAVRRRLRGRFEVETATGVAEALHLLNHGGPYAVIVSDMQMPVMDGGRFLARAKKTTPDSIRIMLTGNADIETARIAVNDGEVFRFLQKPVDPALLEATLEAALKQHALVTAERELLNGTLSGAVQVLTDVLSLVNPAAFGRASRATTTVQALAARLNPEMAWDLEMAAMLSQIGCITVPQETLLRQEHGEALTREEVEMLSRQAEIGRDLIAHIPRLHGVAAIVGAQGQHGPQAPAGAPILDAALAYDLLVTIGHTPLDAVAELEERRVYPAELVLELRTVAEAQQGEQLVQVQVGSLEPGMVLGEALKSSAGLLLVAKGQRVSAALCARVINHCTPEELARRVQVLVAVSGSASDTAARVA
jgi:CheY-like chemotaxis protein